LKAEGYDWSKSTLYSVLTLLDRLDAPSVKIEFQGGEPTLRPDLIEAVLDKLQRFEDRQIVICTNLAQIDERLLKLFDRTDVFISTSLDGGFDVHQQNRTSTTEKTEAFLSNLDFVLQRYGPEKVSALPTVDATKPPVAEDLIESFASRGLTSIFLRPITFHGFARKRHAHAQALGAEWGDYYEQFVHRLIERNWSNRDHVLEETYLSLCLRRIFQAGHDRHVDLRNPNPMGVDYVVIDYDGQVYPTDEARMLSRAGVIDLAIGDIDAGWDTKKRAILNAHASNSDDPSCKACAYQPFCGRDIIDDIARYGSIDRPRTDTEFCRRHLRMFDLAFRLVYSDDPKVRYSLSRWLKLPGIPDQFGPTHDLA
jgi:radical SAM protein with 4Fe4S-binding SPASM domain